MLKQQIYSKFKKYFQEYLFGFDQNQLQLSLFTGNIDLHNVNIRPDKVNELFQKHSLPIALKAGLISKLSVKMNIINIFSDSLKVTIEDILFIVGPNIAHMSQEEDFERDINSPYDENNPLNNLLKMHQRVLHKRKEDKKREKSPSKEDIAEQQKKKAEKLKKRAEQEKKGEFKEVKGISWIISLLGGLKLEVKRIHFRYEDDYFQAKQPFAFGFMIDSIQMENSESDWLFEGPLSMNFSRQKPYNSKTVVKELAAKNIRMYWNSMSEMFVPTSLWEQTRHLEHQIFSALDAQFLKEIMVDAFEKSALNYRYLIQPFTIFTSINLNNNYRYQEDPYRYQFNILISAINLNFNPEVARDLFMFRAFIEMFSYCRDLKKFRPLLRIQSFIDKGQLNSVQTRKKRVVIRDWFKFVLWYVRLKKVVKGETPFSLLEVEAMFQQQNLQNALVKAKRATIHDYQPYHGEGEFDVMEQILPDKQMMTAYDDDALHEYEKQQKEIKKRQILKDMLSGTTFAIRMEGVKLQIQTPGLKIRREHKDMPNLELELSILSASMGIQNCNLVGRVLIKEVKVIDYFKREPEKSSNKQIQNSNSKAAFKNLYQDDINGRDSTQSQQVFGNDGHRSIIENRAQAQSAAAFNTPNKKLRLTDMIYGSGTSIDRAMSRQTVTPYDFFNLDIPDPNQAQNQARETLTIQGLLQSGGKSKQPVKAYRMTTQANDRDVTPTRGSKIRKAQKFQSPYSMNDKRDAMNNFQLNQKSEVFVDDQLERADKRCFFLFCGKTAQIDPAFSVDLMINIFDDPAMKRKITLSVTLDQIIFEYCSEIFKSMTNLILEFKQLFNFSDLRKAPNSSGTKKYKKSLQRIIELQAPLYALRKLLLKKAWKIPQEKIIAYQISLWKQKEQLKSKAQSRKELKDKQFNTIQKIKKIDQKLSDLNFEIGFSIKNIYLGLTADKDDHFIANQTLLEFGIENQSINLYKEDFKCKVSVFGISVTTLNTYEMLYMFVNKLKRVSMMYKEELAVQTMLKNYKDFIQNIQKNLQQKQDQKRREELKEQQKKSQQPKIVVHEQLSHRSSERKNVRHDDLYIPLHNSQVSLKPMEPINGKQSQKNIKPHFDDGPLRIGPKGGQQTIQKQGTMPNDIPGGIKKAPQFEYPPNYVPSQQQNNVKTLAKNVFEQKNNKIQFYEVDSQDEAQYQEEEEEEESVNNYNQQVRQPRQGPVSHTQSKNQKVTIINQRGQKHQIITDSPKYQNRQQMQQFSNDELFEEEQKSDSYSSDHQSQESFTQGQVRQKNQFLKANQMQNMQQQQDIRRNQRKRS